jgi:hypothetical protein
MSDGGHAFPSSLAIDPSGDIHASRDFVDGGGMSLRDWFAGQALPVALAHYPNLREWDLEEMFGERNNLRREEIIAAVAYRFADAMLKAREAKS